MPIKSILAATDFSPHENTAVTRALQLAQAHHATLKLVHLPSPSQGTVPDARAHLTAMARQAEAEHLLNVEVLPAKVDTFEGLAAKAQGIDLIVLPCRQERSLATFFRGQPVVRLLRECDVPVLVTRTEPDKSYTRMVVAVDFSPHSVVLTEWAGRLQPQAELRLFHAIGTADEAKLLFAGATRHAITAHRERCLAHARMKMLALTSHFNGDRSRLLTQIGRGDPARQAITQQERSGAHLIVVGMAQASSCQRFLSSSVAQRILCWGRSDVLIVPHTDSTDSARAGSRPTKAGRRRPDFFTEVAERRSP